MSRTLNQILATTLVGGIALVTGATIDRFVLIPYQQTLRAQAETISNPDASGRVTFASSGFYHGEERYFVRDYRIMTGDGQIVWAIQTTLVEKDGKVELSLASPNGRLDGGKLPHEAFKIGQDVRLQFSGESTIMGANKWVDPNDEYGNKIPNPKVNSFMVMSRYQIVEPVADADNGDYSANVGMIVERSFRLHQGKTENVLLEEYTLLDNKGEAWYFAKKHSVEKDDVPLVKEPLFDLGRMAAISWEDFRLDGEIYYKKEGFEDLMGMDGHGTRREKVVKGIRDYKVTKYSQSESTSTDVVKYSLPIAQSVSATKQISAIK